MVEPNLSHDAVSSRRPSTFGVPSARTRDGGRERDSVHPAIVCKLDGAEANMDAEVRAFAEASSRASGTARMSPMRRSFHAAR